MKKIILSFFFVFIFLDVKSEIIVGINTNDCVLCYKPLYNLAKINKPDFVKVCYPEYVKYLKDTIILKKLLVTVFKDNKNIEIIYNDFLNEKYVIKGRSTINWINKRDTIKISIKDEVNNIEIDSNSFIPLIITIKNKNFPRYIARPFVLGYKEGYGVIYDSPNNVIYWPSFSSKVTFSFSQKNNELYVGCMKTMNFPDSMIKRNIKILNENNIPNLEVGKVKFEDNRLLALLSCRFIDNYDSNAVVKTKYFFFKGKMSGTNYEYELFPIEIHDSLYAKKISINYYYNFLYSDSLLNLRTSLFSLKADNGFLNDSIEYPYLAKFIYNDSLKIFEFDNFYKSSLPKEYVDHKFYYQLADCFLKKDDSKLFSLFHYSDTFVNLTLNQGYSLSTKKDYINGTIENYKINYSNHKMVVDENYVYVLQLDSGKFQYRVIKFDFTKNKIVWSKRLDALDAKKTFNYISENGLIVNKVEGDRYYSKIYFW